MALFIKMGCGCVVLNHVSERTHYPNGVAAPDGCRLWVVIKACDAEDDTPDFHLRPFEHEKHVDSKELEQEECDALMKEIACLLGDGARFRLIREMLK